MNTESTLTRRGFLKLQASALATAAAGMAGLTAGAAGAAGAVVEAAAPGVMTVTGLVPASTLGRTLPHEHVTTDFLGAEKLPAPRYDPDLAFNTALPHFAALKERGVGTLVECTPAYIGRDVRLLRRLSEATGVRILTNTGYYGAVDNKFLPRHALTETEAQLAARWLREHREGIEGTGIRPGFVKLGTGNGPLPEVHARLLRAAAQVHRETGLTLAVHTGDGVAARDEVKILEAAGVAPAALIWVHAQNDSGPIQVELARRGVWISLDGYSVAHRNPERYRNFLITLRREQLLGRVLLSHDDGWAVDGEGAKGAGLTLFGNGNPAPYRSLFERLLPDLRAEGFTDADLEQMLVRNPGDAFAIRRRVL